MRIQNPENLYFLFAIAIPILIHLLNLRKHKTIYFSSIRFLKNIKEQSHQNKKNSYTESQRSYFMNKIINNEKQEPLEKYINFFKNISYEK